MVEWYVNDERGLEQDFTLSARPPGTPKAKGQRVPPADGTKRGQPVLRIEMRVTGDLDGTLGEDRQTIEFITPGGVRVLHYGGLYVFDAVGKALPAWFELMGKNLSIVVDDVGATYPVTIDPLATTPEWTAESNQANANFGYSVSSAGDVNGDGYGDIIIGAYHYDSGQADEGSAFVYHGADYGIELGFAAQWMAEGDQVFAHFGYSVSTASDLNGDGYSDVIVGALSYDNEQIDEGRAFVYHGSAAGLNASANWTSEADQDDAAFGASVSTAGDVNGDGYSDVVVGAYKYGNGEDGEGGAFVYHGSPAGLGASAEWTAESDQVDARFGWSVANLGDVNGDGYSDVIIGAPGYANDQFNEGGAFVYHGSPLGLNVAANWTAESDQDEPYFGNSVATAGDVNGDGYSDVVVGAQFYDHGENNVGAAFVYHGNGGHGLSLRCQQRRTDHTAPVDHLGMSDSADGFDLRMLGRTPYGR